MVAQEWRRTNEHERIKKYSFILYVLLITATSWGNLSSRSGRICTNTHLRVTRRTQQIRSIDSILFTISQLTTRRRAIYGTITCIRARGGPFININPRPIMIVWVRFDRFQRDRYGIAF
jgi:hypothetical protein